MVAVTTRGPIASVYSRIDSTDAPRMRIEVAGAGAGGSVGWNHSSGAFNLPACSTCPGLYGIEASTLVMMMALIVGGKHSDY